MKAAFPSLLAALSSLSYASAQATCNPQFWSVGHDFKNGQYSNVNGTSPADCCAKCAKYTDKTIGQCKFFTFDGANTCWMKSNNKGYRAAKGATCGSVGNVPLPTPAPTMPPAPTLPPLPTPTTPAPTPWNGDPVQVYVMMGQSNMLGEGKIMGPQNTSLETAVFELDKYPYMKNAAQKTWSVFPNMRNVFIMGNGNAPYNVSKHVHNEWLTAATGGSMGPEFGIAGTTTGKNVMLMKSCIGNRALGWDLLPPGTPRHDFTDSKGDVYTYAGYHDSPMKWLKSAPKPPNGSWVAGSQFDGDTNNVQHVLANLTAFFPGATKYEIAGFFWWQGDKDSRDAGLSAAYETNLVALIKGVRKLFNAPTAPFVTAALGQTVLGSTSGDGEILNAMLNVGCNGNTQGAETKCKYPEFKGNVAAIYTHPLENTPGSSGGHYGGDALTYTNVGQAMGSAMAAMKKAAAQ